MTRATPSRRSGLIAAARNWREVFLIVAFLLGCVGMFTGTTLSERDIADAGWGTRIYYALSLFVFGGVDLGVPVGGPICGRVMLWIAYFMAPVVTLSAVFEAALRLINAQGRRMRRLRDHVIVCGGGRLARLYIRRLRESGSSLPIVVIERDANKAMLRELREVYGVYVVIGNIASDEVLAQARLERAQRVVLLTGDDFSNLDAAARIIHSTPRLRGRVIAHVADLAFLHTIPSEVLGDSYETFNSLESAAIHLVEQRLLAVFASTAYRDVVMLAGFGRFGQTLLEELQRRAADQFGTVIIIDLDARTHVQRFADHIGFGDRAYHVLEGHLREPGIWHRVEELLEAGELGRPVCIVGTGDESTNLQTAVDLRQRYADAHITVRSFLPSPFAQEVAGNLDIEPLVLAQLISDSMPAHWLEDAS